MVIVHFFQKEFTTKNTKTTQRTQRLHKEHKKNATRSLPRVSPLSGLPSAVDPAAATPHVCFYKKILSVSKENLLSIFCNDNFSNFKFYLQLQFSKL